MIDTITVRTLTPLWTGGIDERCSKLKETGIIGSLRWWYEALVRGLGGYACDPTSDENPFNKCELDQKKFKQSLDSGKNVQEVLDEQLCPACQLFGCGGWKRRFRLEVGDINKNCFDNWGLKKESEFSINITEFDKIKENYKWLFKNVLWIIEKYGAIGGRTTRKPQNSKIGMPYGLIKIEGWKEKDWDTLLRKETVQNWLKKNKENLNKCNHQGWFDFRYYWYVDKKYLNRAAMNRVLKLVEIRENNIKKTVPERGTENDEFFNFLRGRQGVSKKIFSFGNGYSPVNPRVFGYVRNEQELEKILKMIEKELREDIKFVIGEDILKNLGDSK